MEKEVRMNKGSEDGGVHRCQGRGRRHIHQQNIFLPMFCRLSIKDVLNQTKDRSNVPKPGAISSTVQLKRNKTVTCLPDAAGGGTFRTRTGNNNLNMSRSMKKWASSETQLVPRATTCTSKSAAGVTSGGGGSGGSPCRLPGSGDMSFNDDHGDGNQGCAEAVIGNMSEMDPPLPVVKRVAPPGGGGDEMSIWKRRFNGVALKSLQIPHQISPT